jgi:xanthine dehydrogenase accessory factor
VALATIISAPTGAPTVAGTKLLVRHDGGRAGAFGGALEDAVAADCLAAITRVPRESIQALYYGAAGEQIHRLEAKEDDAFEVMVEVIEAPASLLIVGGGHIGLSLATIAALSGFSVAVLDDRDSFANAERFPMADRVMAGDFDEHLGSFPISGNTYIVMVSRGHKQDETALRLVVNRGAAYVGMIGSRRRVGTVLRHLAEEGYPVDALDAVYTPVGFDIGAETPEEIAVSILAEVISVRRRGSGRPMRERRASLRTTQASAPQ